MAGTGNPHCSCMLGGGEALSGSVNQILPARNSDFPLGHTREETHQLPGTVSGDFWPVRTARRYQALRNSQMFCCLPAVSQFTLQESLAGLSQVEAITVKITRRNLSEASSSPDISLEHSCSLWERPSESIWV